MRPPSGKDTPTTRRKDEQIALCCAVIDGYQDAARRYAGRTAWCPGEVTERHDRAHFTHAVKNIQASLESTPIRTL